MLLKHKFFKSLIAVILAVAFLPVSIVMAAGTEQNDSIKTTSRDISSLVQVDNETSYVAITAGGETTKLKAGESVDDIDDGATIKIYYAFSMPDTNGKHSEDEDYEEYTYNSGDTYTVQLPEGLVYDTSTVHDGGIPVKDGFDVQMGLLTFSTDSDTGETSATVTFGDYVENKSGITGWFEIDGTFSEESISSGDPITINFTSPAITITPQKADESTLDIQKKGKYDQKSNMITWEVEVTPSRGSFKDVSVDDVFGDNQTYVEDSFKVTKGIKFDKSKLNVDEESRTISYTFPEKVGSTQIFRYCTKPLNGKLDATMDGETSFENTANLTATLKNDNDTTATVTATVLAKPDWIKKLAGQYNNTKKTIPWTIEAGIKDQTIEEAKIVDTLPDGLTIDSDSEVKWSLNGETKIIKQHKGDQLSPTFGTFGYSDTNRKLIVNLGEFTGRGKLTYSTKVNKVNLNTNNSSSYKNTAKLVWKDNNEDTAPKSEGTGKVWYGGLIYKWASENRNYNDSNRIIKWVIRVNHNKISMLKDTTVEDIIPENQEYYTDETHKFAISPDPEGEISINKENNKFTYKFTKDFSDTYIITYYTKLTDVSSLYSNGKVYINNIVNLKRPGIDTIKNIYGKQTFYSQVIAKNVEEEYNYDTHEVTWKITVNRNSLPMKNAVITDTIPDGMKYVPGSFQLDDNTVDDSSLKISNDASSKQTVSYQFTGDINKQYNITLKTKVTDAVLQKQFNQKEFINEASLDSDEITEPITSQAKVRVKNEILTKTADYDNGSDFINWVVEVNKGKLTLSSGTTLTDKLQSGLSFEKDSVQIFPATVNAADGKLTAKSTPLSTDDYTVGYITNKDDPNFNQVTFTFNNKINEAYLMYFTTDIIDSTKDINNQVSLEGTGVSETPTSMNKLVSLSSLRAGGGGTSGQITVTKEGPDGKLADATFKLLNIKKEVVAEGQTDASGKVTFSNLPFHVFYVVESNEPNGYLRNTVEKKVRLSSDESTVSVTIEDEKALGTVSLQKVSTSGVLLSGGRFRLTGTDWAGNPVSIEASSSGGTVSFRNVPVGINYQIREITAPSGYKRTTEVPIASVDYTTDHSGLVVTVTPSKLENKKIHHNGGGGGGGGTTPPSEPSSSTPTVSEPGTESSSNPSTPESSIPDDETVSSLLGSIYIKKADVNGKALSGAEFTLFDSNGNVMNKKVTGSSGIIIFSDLAPESYSIKETKAPEKFKIFSDPLNVTLGAGQKIGYTLKDVRESDKGVLGWTESKSLPKTGEFPTDVAVFAIGFLFALAGILFGLRTSRKKEIKHIFKNSRKIDSIN